MGIDNLRERRWILLPGTLCNAAAFDGFLNSVGVGKSRRYPISLRHAHVEDYLTELNELMRPGAVVCGFSLGALVAAHLADKLDAAALVLFALNPFADDPAKAADRQSLAEAVRSVGGRAALEPRLPPIHGPSPAQTREHILSMADDTAEFIGPQTTLALTRPGAMTALAAARCPILLLTGSEDITAPLVLAQAAANAAVDGRALVLDGLGHYALSEDPRLCHATLREGFHL